MVLVRVSTAFVFLALIVVVAGCGGGGGSSSAEENSAVPAATPEGPKEAFIAETDALCSDFQAKTAPMKSEIEDLERSSNPESPKNEIQLAELLKKVIVDAEAELESIRRIEPPQGDASTIEAMLGAAEEGNGLADEGAEALEEGETSRLGELAEEAEAVNGRAKAMAEGYGLKVCGQAP